MEEPAAVSGFSRATVSKYFHDLDSVRASTRARIEQALDRYDHTGCYAHCEYCQKIDANIPVALTRGLNEIAAK